MTLIPTRALPIILALEQLLNKSEDLSIICCCLAFVWLAASSRGAQGVLRIHCSGRMAQARRQVTDLAVGRAVTTIKCHHKIVCVRKIHVNQCYYLKKNSNLYHQSNTRDKYAVICNFETISSISAVQCLLQPCCLKETFIVYAMVSLWWVQYLDRCWSVKLPDSFFYLSGMVLVGSLNGDLGTCFVNYERFQPSVLDTFLLKIMENVTGGTGRNTQRWAGTPKNSRWAGTKLGIVGGSHCWSVQDA